MNICGDILETKVRFNKLYVRTFTTLKMSTELT